MTQLSLLEWKQPVLVIPFPSDRRIGKIRSFADKYRRCKTDAARLKAWREVLGKMIHQMNRAGLPEETIQTELEAFKQAAIDEIERRYWLEQQAGGVA